MALGIRRRVTIIRRDIPPRQRRWMSGDTEKPPTSRTPRERQEGVPIPRDRNVGPTAPRDRPKKTPDVSSAPRDRSRTVLKCPGAQGHGGLRFLYRTSALRSSVPESWKGREVSWEAHLEVPESWKGREVSQEAKLEVPGSWKGREVSREAHLELLVQGSPRHHPRPPSWGKAPHGTTPGLPHGASPPRTPLQDTPPYGKTRQGTTPGYPLGQGPPPPGHQL